MRWSMIRDDVIYGEIEGVKEGDIFEDRKALMRAKVQSGWVAGITTGGASITVARSGTKMKYTHEIIDVSKE